MESGRTSDLTGKYPIQSFSASASLKSTYATVNAAKDLRDKNFYPGTELTAASETRCRGHDSCPCERVTS